MTLVDSTIASGEEGALFPSHIFPIALTSVFTEQLAHLIFHLRLPRWEARALARVDFPIPGKPLNITELPLDMASDNCLISDNRPCTSVGSGAGPIIPLLEVLEVGVSLSINTLPFFEMWTTVLFLDPPPITCAVLVDMRPWVSNSESG